MISAREYNACIVCGKRTRGMKKIGGKCTDCFKKNRWSKVGRWRQRKIKKEQKDEFQKM